MTKSSARAWQHSFTELDIVTLWVSVRIFCSKPCLTSWLAPSWCLAACNTNPGQAGYVCVCPHTQINSQTHSTLHALIGVKYCGIVPYFIPLGTTYGKSHDCNSAISLAPQSTSEICFPVLMNLLATGFETCILMSTTMGKKKALIHRGPILKIHSNNFRICLIKETLEWPQLS